MVYVRPMDLTYIIVISWWIAACQAAKVPRGFSKRKFIFKRIEDCEYQGLGTWTTTATLVKSGRTYLLNGNTTWPLDINENMKVRLTASLFKDGQFHDGYIDVIIDGCEQFENLSNGFLRALFSSTDVGINQCPYPKGTYVYKNFKMESNPTLPNSIPNGLYKLLLYIIDKKENILGCINSYVDVKPDKRKGTY